MELHSSSYSYNCEISAAIAVQRAANERVSFVFWPDVFGNVRDSRMCRTVLKCIVKSVAVYSPGIMGYRPNRLAIAEDVCHASKCPSVRYGCATSAATAREIMARSSALPADISLAIYTQMPISLNELFCFLFKYRNVKNPSEAQQNKNEKKKNSPFQFDHFAFEWNFVQYYYYIHRIARHSPRSQINFFFFFFSPFFRYFMTSTEFECAAAFINMNIIIELSRRKRSSGRCRNERAKERTK